MSSEDLSVQVPILMERDPNVLAKNLVTKLDALSQPSGLYNQLSVISKDNMIFYGIIIIITAILFSKMNLNMNILLGLLFGGFVVYYLWDRDKTLSTGEFQTLEIKMQSLIPVPKFFYINANLIELMYNLLDFAPYSSVDFSDTIEHIDNVLKIQLDIEEGMSDCKADIDVMIDEMNRALESLSNILVAIPGDSIVLKNKLVDGIELLHLYLTRHVDHSKKLCGNIKLA